MPSATDYFEMLESGATTLALVTGGVWTYKVFVQQRQKYPRATLTLAVSDRRAPDGRVLLHVVAELKNIGTTLINVRQVEIVVQRLEPVQRRLLTELLDAHDPHDARAACEIPWYRVAHRRQRWAEDAFHIEPGESDSCQYDLVLKPTTRLVRVSVHVVNQTKRWGGRVLSVRRPETTIGWKASVDYRMTSARETAPGDSAPSGRGAATSTPLQGGNDGEPAR